MNILSVSIYDFDIDFVYFLDPKANLIMSGYFIKIMYTSPYFTLNSTYLSIPRVDVEWIKNMECSILEKYLSCTKKSKTCSFTLKGKKCHTNCILKISGIWESESEVGLIYKWIDSYLIS